MDDKFEEINERRRRARLEGVKRWVEYIQTHPPEVWGAEQNALVNSVLQSARETGLSPDHHRRIRAFGEHASDEDGPQE